MGTRCIVVTFGPLNAKSSFGSSEHWKVRKCREGFSSVRCSVNVEDGAVAEDVVSDGFSVLGELRDMRARGSEAGRRNVGAGIVVTICVVES